MKEKPTFLNRFAITAVLLGVVLGVATTIAIAVATYGTWGYERYLASEAYPIDNAQIHTEYQFQVQYRKRFVWLPGASHRTFTVSPDDIKRISHEAIKAYDFSAADIRGTTYSFVDDYVPVPGQTERNPETTLASPKP